MRKNTHWCTEARHEVGADFFQTSDCRFIQPPYQWCHVTTLLDTPPNLVSFLSSLFSFTNHDASSAVKYNVVLVNKEDYCVDQGETRRFGCLVV